MPMIQILKTLPENFSNFEELNPSKTSTELYNEVEHLFEKSSEISTKDEDNEPLIFQRAKKRKRAELGKTNDEFQFHKIQYMASYEEINRIAHKTCVARFFDYFPQKSFGSHVGLHRPQNILKWFRYACSRTNFH